MNLDILIYLKNREWTGNIRELENFIERLVTIANTQSEELNLNTITGNIRHEISDYLNNSSGIKKMDLVQELSEFEKNLIYNILEENEWNQSETARRLDIPEQTLRYKMKKLGIINRSKHSVY